MSSLDAFDSTVTDAPAGNADTAPADVAAAEPQQHNGDTCVVDIAAPDALAADTAVVPAAPLEPSASSVSSSQNDSSVSSSASVSDVVSSLTPVPHNDFSYTVKSRLLIMLDPLMRRFRKQWRRPSRSRMFLLSRPF